MAGPELPREVLQQVIDAHEKHGHSVTKAAQELNLIRSTFESRLKRARAEGLRPFTPKPFERDELPNEELPIEDLVAHRIRQFEQKKKAKLARKIIPVRIKIDGPIGIAHFGDPHVDDDGTDLGLLLSHAKLIRDTEGLFAGNVGDQQNLWIGRLARLWAQQSTSATQAWKLVEHFVSQVDWLYLLSGNHDLWAGNGDPLQWIMRQTSAVFEPHGARLDLEFSNGARVRINARHDFTGHSMWNTAHGPAKAVQMGWRDHILTCGHKHTSGYQVLKDPSSGLISHALRVASYKTFDRYADEKGLPDQAIFNCPVTIIDPEKADDDPAMVTTLFDPFEGAEFLTWKRKRWSSGRRS